jgi:hypothetical protein
MTWIQYSYLRHVWLSNNGSIVSALPILPQHCIYLPLTKRTKYLSTKRFWDTECTTTHSNYSASFRAITSVIMTVINPATRIQRLLYANAKSVEMKRELHFQITFTQLHASLSAWIATNNMILTINWHTHCGRSCAKCTFCNAHFFPPTIRLH